MTPATKTTLTIGQIVHFHDGASRCRAAIVSDVPELDQADLAVLYQGRDMGPTDLRSVDGYRQAAFFARGVPYSAIPVGKSPTFHWPDDDAGIEAAIAAGQKSW
jgi:hypothetical protein